MKPKQALDDAPTASQACLYGLVGDVARAGGDGTEANPYAIAVNFMAYLSCAVGCGPYLPVGNTWHHPRLFTLHIGRSGRGRKGDALSLVLRLDAVVRKLGEPYAPQLHRGGLSTREGLVALIHDGYRHGRLDIPAVDNKRLWVVESEFANVLHQGRRDGNTLSAALRDCWDGVCLKPATKTNRMFASNPHVCLSGAITPGELSGMLSARDLTNGFANRFLMIWAERQHVLPFPQATSQAVVDALSLRILQILKFVGADQYQRRNHMRMELTEQAQQRYAQIYRHELNDEHGAEHLASLKERHAPMLLRMAMLFALTDMQARIDLCHIEAAMVWIHYADASVQFVFSGGAKLGKAIVKTVHADRIVEFLRQRGRATRQEISVECFRGHVSKVQIDAAINGLLNSGTPCIRVQIVPRSKASPGNPTTFYQLFEAQLAEFAV